MELEVMILVVREQALRWGSARPAAAGQCRSRGAQRSLFLQLWAAEMGTLGARSTSDCFKN